LRVENVLKAIATWQEFQFSLVPCELVVSRRAGMELGKLGCFLPL
jgi:hypothetical protein